MTISVRLRMRRLSKHRIDSTRRVTCVYCMEWKLEAQVGSQLGHMFNAIVLEVGRPTLFTVMSRYTVY